MHFYIIKTIIYKNYNDLNSWKNYIFYLGEIIFLINNTFIYIWIKNLKNLK
jgi:hypothetical protein